MTVTAQGITLQITDHDGLAWTLALTDPDWPRMLRRLIADIRSADTTHADRVIEQLPYPWCELYRHKEGL